MIANFRVQADLKGMETTTDGRLDNHLCKTFVYMFPRAGLTAGPNRQTFFLRSRVTGGSHRPKEIV